MTYSLVARDAETGQLGIAVQTRSFAVGAAVPWALPGVGAVATQAFTERSYGPLGLRLLEAGKTPEQALEALLAADPQADTRQVAIVDAEGRAAAHTGERCIPAAGHRLGDGFSAQGNLLASPTVWPAMAEAFDAAEGTLARRLLAALDAGQTAGGDFRGKQTAALLVVSGDPTGAPWDAKVADLRVDDHAEPVAELRRLVELSEAYRRLNQLRGDVPPEEVEAARAAGVHEDQIEWFVVAAAWRAGDLEEAGRRLGPLLARDERWSHALDVLAVTPPPEDE